jgi:glycosyltransferase involved in cell wall biosynthesis
MRRPLPGARYVAVSEVRRREVAETLGIPDDSIDVVPNGVDVTEVTGLRPTTAGLLERLGLADADPLLVLPARLTPRKRVEIAIDAVALLRSRRPSARLVVTGAPDPHPVAGPTYHDELAKRSAASGGAAVLVFERLGHELPRRRLTEVLRVADALVFPSAREGFGIPIIEAAAVRLPIVCTDLPVLREVAGPDATYVPLDADAARWADAIEATIDGDRTARLARRVRATYDLGPLLRERVVPTILR